MSPDSSATESRDPAAVCSEITRNLTRTVAAATGRGPNRVRTFINDTLVTVLLEDVLTRAEKTLAVNARAETVLSGRRMLQSTLKPEFTAIVATATGREVVAFLSATHVGPDVEIESFLLAAAL